MPSRYKEFMDTWNSADAKTQEVLLTRMNVTLVERFDPGTDSDASFAPVVASPRARWSSCAISVGDEEDALLMLSGNIDPGTVIIEGSVGQANCESGGEASPQITGGNANQVEITVSSPQPGWLLLADTYYPGWQVYVNGKETTIYPADGMFRGVHLEAGRSQIQFVYRPMWFFVGAGISVAAWLILIVLWRRNTVQ
jgi:hypothetical protein